ncbi:hypothetical protein D3C85_1377770 [compost metagenome]
MQDGFCLGELPFGEQRLGLLEWVGFGGWWCLYMRFEQGADSRLRLGTGKTIDRLAVLEQHYGWQAANAEAGNDVLLGFAVDLGQ